MVKLSFPLRPRVVAADSVVIIGLGRFGRSMALELMESGVEVLGIDRSVDVVQQLNGRLTQVIRADASSIDTLRDLGVAEFSHAVVAIGDDLASSILVASALLKLNGPEIWAKASTGAQGEIFNQMGIKHVFHPEKDMGRRVAHLLTHSLSDYFDLGDGFAMATAALPAYMAGASLRDLNLRVRLGITIVAVKDSEGVWAPILPESVLETGQVVLVAGQKQKLDEAFKH